MWFLKYKLIDNNLIQSARIKFIESLVEEKSNDSQSTKKKKIIYGNIKVAIKDQNYAYIREVY